MNSEKLRRLIKFYKVREYLKMMRQSLKLTRKQVAEALHVNERDIYNLEFGETMRYKLAPPLLQAISALYKIDYDILYQKMLDEHETYRAL